MSAGWVELRRDLPQDHDPGAVLPLQGGPRRGHLVLARRSTPACRPRTSRSGCWRTATTWHPRQRRPADLRRVRRVHRAGHQRAAGIVSDRALLVPEVDRPRARAATRLPAQGLRHRPRAGGGSRDPRQQPPVVRRLAVHAAHAHPAGHLRRQGRVLHHPRHQGLVPEEVLHRRRAGADRPVGRQRRGGRDEVGDEDPRRGRPVRDLPRGHPVPRRQALPRQDRRGPARARERRPGHPVRGGRHRRRGPDRQGLRHVDAPGRALRQAPRLLPLRRHGERPLHPALDHRRDHVRDHAALRAGVRRPLRQQGEGARQGEGQAGRAAEKAEREKAAREQAEDGPEQKAS